MKKEGTLSVPVTQYAAVLLAALDWRETKDATADTTDWESGN